jgi:putative NADH-flavin reductase
MRQIDSYRPSCHRASVRQNVSKRIAVLGSTGGTGRHVVTAALAAGHEVVAPVRRPGAVRPAPGLRETVWADVADQETLAAALAGVDVVISALGGAENGPTTVCTDAIRTSIPAMTEVGVTRLVVVSAHGVLETHDRSLYARAAWSRVGEKLKDKETMEALVVASSLVWTIVRPPLLRDTPANGRYQVGESLPIRVWHSIGRSDLAGFLVGEAGDARFAYRRPRIRR